MPAQMSFVGALALVLAAASPGLANMAYVTNEKGNSVSVIDTAAMEVTKTIKVGQRPRGVALSKDDSLLFVCAGDDDTIQIIDTKTLKIVGDLPSGPDPEQLRVSPDGATVFVANENDALLTAIDVASRKVVTEFSVGVEPEGVAVSPDGNMVVNTSETTSMAHLIDKRSAGNIRAGGLFRLILIHHNRAPCAERTGFPFGVEHCVLVRRGAHDARVTQPPLRLQPIRGSSQ